MSSKQGVGCIESNRIVFYSGESPITNRNSACYNRFILSCVISVGDVIEQVRVAKVTAIT